MTFNTNINGVPIAVTVSLWSDRPSEITGVKTRSMVGNLKPILAADAFAQLDAEIRASADFQKECQRPDESAKVPFDMLGYTSKVLDIVTGLTKAAPKDPKGVVPQRYCECGDWIYTDDTLCPGCRQDALDKGHEDEPMTIGHVSGCLCSDCLSERARVIELGNRIEEAR